MDKNLKISSLCNYEQSHVFGLRLLGFLQSDLDVLLLIESQYNSSRVLLELQKKNRRNRLPLNSQNIPFSTDPNNEDECENYTSESLE